VETVAIAAIRRIRVSCESGLAMDALHITVVRVASGAFLDHPGLIPSPWGYLMDFDMAVLTLNIVDEVGTGVMFRALLLMTPMTGDGFGMNFPPFCLSMGLDVCDVPVATITRIGSMNGLGKLPLVDLIPMAAQTFRVVDTLQTIFPTLNSKFLHLFPGLGRRGHSLRFGTLFFGNGFRSPN
jgi:hypothetical protein